MIGFPLFAVWLSVFKKKQLNRDGSKLHLRFASLFEDMRKSHSYFIALQQMKDLGLAVCISFVYNAPTTQMYVVPFVFVSSLLSLFDYFVPTCLSIFAIFVRTNVMYTSSCCIFVM